MGKFERKINKMAKKDAKSFDEWYTENATELRGFEKNIYVKTKVNMWKLIATSAASLVVVFGAVMFSINAINAQPSDEPLLDFAETEIYTTQATGIESDLFMNAMGFDFNLQYSTYQAVRTIKNDDLVFMIIYGEIETETDYYLLTFKFHINERYHFIEKAEYESLKNEMTVGDYAIWYEFNETLSDELKTYNMKIARNESVCYLEMQCFEDDFDGFIALLSK